ncbi:MAG: hypothetical protein GTN78_13110, partial [Gemmatimonadales bacterium]|nr:hypothetical protein [Gemmatimonadales bacterium]NIR01116.1 hypothetical protein [Gemmatimonadales bacterium]
MRNCGVVLAALSVVAVSTACSGESVKMYETSLVIPTYEVGRPDPNPRFYMGR